MNNKEDWNQNRENYNKSDLDNNQSNGKADLEAHNPTSGKTDNKNVFIMKNDKGEEVECEVMMTIDSEEFNSHYIIYTDHTMTDDGNINTYASHYDPTGKSLDLNPVTTDAEWNMIESVLASAQKQIIKESMEEKEEN